MTIPTYTQTSGNCGWLPTYSKIHREKEMWTFIKAIYIERDNWPLVDLCLRKRKCVPCGNDVGNRSVYRFFLFLFILLLYVVSFLLLCGCQNFRLIFLRWPNIRFHCVTCLWCFPMLRNAFIRSFENNFRPWNKTDILIDVTCLLFYLFLSFFLQISKFFHRINGCDLLRVDTFCCQRSQPVDTSRIG